MDPRQLSFKESLVQPESRPEGVMKVTPLKERIDCLEYAVSILLQLTADTELSPHDRARLLAAYALVSRRSSSKSTPVEPVGT